MHRFELIEDVARLAPQEGLTESAVPGLWFYRQSQATTEPLPVIYDPSICVIARGQKTLRVGNRTIRYDPWHYLVNALTLPVEATIEEASEERPFLGFLIRFDAVELGKLLAEVDDHLEWPSDPCVGTMDAGPLEEPLLAALHRLFHSLDHPADRRALAPSLMREALYAVLRGPLGPILREQVSRGSAAHRIGRAVAFLEQHFHEPLDIETIAETAAMSSSTLHHHFKRLTSLSPIQYVQRLRLHRARALLLSGWAAAEAGFEVGYRSPSQFSREFRRLFGHPPSRLRPLPGEVARLPAADGRAGTF
ncbi:MAG: AraC family transcriptional regulator [Acidobacteriota bacterium]